MSASGGRQFSELPWAPETLATPLSKDDDLIVASGPVEDNYKKFQEYVKNNERGTVLETLIGGFYRNIKATEKFKIVDRIAKHYK